MNQPFAFNKALHRFALFTAVSTFFLIVAGGLVTSTNSGLAVPDWPLSYGQIMPPMVGGIFYEHGHRMIASFVGLLTTVLAFWLWRKESRKWVRVLGFIALAAVIIQGILGGLTVIFLLPTPISVSHATLAQSFFCIIAALALFTSRWWHDEPSVVPREAGFSLLAVSSLLFLSVFIQLVLGAIMRHTQSGLAIPDFPLSYGYLVPPLDASSLAQYNATLLKTNVRIYADGFVTDNQIVIHLLHRYWALAVLSFSTWTVVKAIRSPISRVRFLAYLFSGLMIVQITLGALTVLLRKEVWVTTAHVANGAFLLCLSVLLFLHLARVSGFSLASLPLALHRKGALA